jgi:predicted amino acid racemase
MGEYPKLIIDLNKIEHNTSTISTLASKHDITITCVTKCCCGDPRVAQAMIAGGAKSIADSRVENLKKMKEAEIETELMLLRTPMLSQVKEVVKYADISLNSDIGVITELSHHAEKTGKPHKIIVMVEMGDLREGVPVTLLGPLIDKVLKLNNIELYGLGMNLACFGGIVPTQAKLQEFSDVVDKIENEFNLKFQMVSGGNSANIPLLLEPKQSTRIDHLRIGEGILLGLETVNRTPIPGTFQDAFVVEAELIELFEKPSVPSGEISQNAFGETPRFDDKGLILRGILALGRQDVIVDGLTPLDQNISILGSSSDHILVRVKSDGYKVGDKVRFKMDYGGLLHLFTSSYVEKKYLNE